MIRFRLELPGSECQEALFFYLLFSYLFMANYCSNSVRFLGPATAIDQIRAVFENIENKQQRTNRYHLPDFVQVGMGYMEDIAIGPD